MVDGEAILRALFTQLYFLCVGPQLALTYDDAHKATKPPPPLPQKVAIELPRPEIIGRGKKREVGNNGAINFGRNRNKAHSSVLPIPSKFS